MPNIELYGYKHSDRIEVKQKIRNVLADYRDKKEVVITTILSDVENLEEKMMPFMRLIATKAELPEMKARLIRTKEDLEVIVLDEWIEKRTEVATDNPLLDLSPKDYFTFERFAEGGFTSHVCKRAVNAIAELTIKAECRRVSLPTMRDFLEYYDNPGYITKLKNCGVMTSRCIFTAIRSGGLSLKETKGG